MCRYDQNNPLLHISAYLGGWESITIILNVSRFASALWLAGVRACARLLTRVWMNTINDKLEWSIVQVIA